MIHPVDELRDFVTAALVQPVERNHEEPPDRLVHRRWVAAVTLAVGSFMMAWTIRIPPGDPTLFAAMLALAVTWIVGTLLSGRIYRGAGNSRRGTQNSRAIIQSVAVGLALIAGFLALGVLVAAIPVLRDPLLQLIAYARPEMMPLLLILVAAAAVAEEVFFRGGLYAATGGPHAVLITAFVYALTAVPTANPMLIFGSAVLGLVLGLQRRVTGGVLAPVITHLTWLLGMGLLLPGVLNLWH